MTTTILSIIGGLLMVVVAAILGYFFTELSKKAPKEDIAMLAKMLERKQDRTMCDKQTEDFKERFKKGDEKFDKMLEALVRIDKRTAAIKQHITGEIESE